MVKPCVFLSEIDYYNTKLETTMRDIIMDLETLYKLDDNDQPMKIFLCVDYSQWHSSYVLTFPSYLENEADDYIAQLPAYLHYVYLVTVRKNARQIYLSRTFEKCARRIKTQK